MSTVALIWKECSVQKLAGTQPWTRLAMTTAPTA